MRVLKKRNWQNILIALVTVLLPGGRNQASEEPVKATEMLVAAAAYLKFVTDEMVQEFQKAHPEIRVKVSYGSSGNFYSQLSNHAPFDIYFSADIAYPLKLMEQGLALQGSDFTYAVG